MASAGDRWTQKPQYRVGLLVLERKRDGFDVAWGKKTRGKCWEALVTICGNNGYALKPLNGDHERVADDRSLRRALQKAHGDVDVVVATQPTISDGRLAAVLAQACAVPVVLWATPENPDVRGSPVGGVSSNSLVGTHLFAATLRQLGRRDVELVYQDQDWTAAASQLSRAIARAAGTARIKTAKIGLIGHQAPGFVDLHPDPFALHKTFQGCVLEHVGLADLVQAAEGIDQESVDADRKVNVPGAFADRVDDERSSRLYLALKRLVEAENLDAIAIRCWPELPRDYGQWPYLAVTRLADEGLPVACEGDVDGALTMLCCKFLGCGAPYISDWLEHDRSSFVCWHGGMCPTCLTSDTGDGGGPRIRPHFNNKKPAVVDATLKPGMDVTVCRFWVCDGKYHAMICNGRSKPAKRPLSGNNGLVELDLSDRGGRQRTNQISWRFSNIYWLILRTGGRDLFACFEDWVVQYGMPHHVIICQGHHKASLTKFASARGVKIV